MEVELVEMEQWVVSRGRRTVEGQNEEDSEGKRQ